MSETKTVTYSIGGMSCASCSAAVEKVVRNLNGSISAQVNLAAEKGTFVFNPSVLRPTHIKQAIEKAGFKILENEERSDREKRKQSEKQILFNNLVISFFSSVPLLYLAMGMMIPGITLPLPHILDPMH